jgi:hypothetical protein
VPNVIVVTYYSTWMELEASFIVISETESRLVKLPATTADSGNIPRKGLNG